VLAAHQFVVQADVGIGTATKDNSAFFQGNLLELSLGVQDYQVGVQLQHSEGDGVARCNDGLVQILHIFSNDTFNIVKEGLGFRG